MKAKKQGGRSEGGGTRRQGVEVCGARHCRKTDPKWEGERQGDTVARQKAGVRVAEKEAQMKII